MYVRLMWINILTKNAIICLMWNIYNLCHGHWSDTKSKVNGVGGVLQEVENEFWGYASNEGPFEHPEEDFRKWVDYINAKKVILMKEISNIQSRLHEVQEKMDSLYKDNNRKEPGINTSQTKDTPLGSPSTLGDVLQTLKKYLVVISNWAAFLEEVKTSWGEGVPVEEIERAMKEMENERDTVDQGEVVKIRLLLRNLKKNIKTRKENANVNCNGPYSKIGNVLRHVQKNLSETFLYRNITLTEINQMSKIVDFIERYRGRVEKILRSETTENVAQSEIQTEKKLNIAGAPEN